MARRQEKSVHRSSKVTDRPRIGFIRDRAFWFYYPENLEQLEDLGAELVCINATTDKRLPEIDALYIGGGFPKPRQKPFRTTASSGTP